MLRVTVQLACLMLLAISVYAQEPARSWSTPPIWQLQADASPESGVLEISQASDWELLDNESPNLGFNTGPVWLKMAVPELRDPITLEIAYPLLDRVDYFLLANGNLIQSMTVGDHLPYDQRPVLHPYFLIPLKQNIEGPAQVYLRIETTGALQAPIRFWEREALLLHMSNVDQMQAFYYGFILSVVCFNFFIFLFLREKTYLLYCLATLSFLFLLAILRGTTLAVLWPDNSRLHEYSILLTVPITMIFGLLFARSFLDIPNHSPKTDRLMRLAVFLNAGSVVGAFVLTYNASLQLSVAIGIFSSVLMGVIGPLQWWKRNQQAGLYTLGWSALSLGSALTTANLYGVLPTSFIATYGMQFGSAAQALILTIALALRLYQERENGIASRDSELKALESRRHTEIHLMEQALHNPLTGLPNRQCFDLVLKNHIRQHPDKPLLVGVLRLNDLAAITKTLGHQASDELIGLASQRFNTIASEIAGVQPVDHESLTFAHLASLENDSLGILINPDTEGFSRNKLSRSVELMREPLDFLGMQLALDPRLGIAVFSEHSDDPHTLVRLAYIAQESEEARDQGLAYYSQTRDVYNAARLTLVAELRDALNRDQLELYFQPKLSLKSHRIVGVEALLRWPGREKPIPTDEIIALAEQSGLIKPLTRWVLTRGLKARTALVDSGFDLTISINVSPNNLREPEFALFVQGLMKEFSEHRGKTILEVTETSMMQDPKNSLKALRALNSTGIPLSIDDFGSGYSSLSYIKQLPAKEIKIDRSLIMDIVREPEDQMIVSTTISMCHSLGYSVVAEGVEDTATKDILQEMGCDVIQGYLLTPPLPYGRFLAWLEEYSTSRQAI